MNMLILLFVLKVNGAGTESNCNLIPFPGKAADSIGISNPPTKEMKLHFNCDGVLDHIYIHKGNTFKKGQLLASLRYEDVNIPIMSAVFYLDKARESLVFVRSQVEEKKQPPSQLELAKKNLDDAEANYEKALTAGGNYYLTAEANGLVIDEAAKAGDQVNAGQTILIVKWK
jgi:multidrug resistance efflux pump